VTDIDPRAQAILDAADSQAEAFERLVSSIPVDVFGDDQVTSIVSHLLKAQSHLSRGTGDLLKYLAEHKRI
jgi:hypothetical protein